MGYTTATGALLETPSCTMSSRSRAIRWARSSMARSLRQPAPSAPTIVVCCEHCVPPAIAGSSPAMAAHMRLALGFPPGRPSIGIVHCRTGWTSPAPVHAGRSARCSWASDSTSACVEALAVSNSRPSVLVGFADALAAPEAAASLLASGYRVVSFSRRGRAVALRHMRGVEIVEVTAPEQDFDACVRELADVASAHDVIMP